MIVLLKGKFDLETLSSMQSKLNEIHLWSTTQTSDDKQLYEMINALSRTAAMFSDIIYQEVAHGRIDSFHPQYYISTKINTVYEMYKQQIKEET